METKDMAIYALCISILVGAGITAGMFSQPEAGALVGGQVPAVTTTFASISAGGCPTTGITDMQSSARQSIADPSTGIKTQIHGTIAYYYQGEVTPFETTTLSNTAYASSTTDPPCGTAGIVGVFTNSSYYHLKFNVPQIPLAPSVVISTIEPDLISAVSLYGYNETNGGAQTETAINIALEASSTSSDARIQIKPTTARGVVHQPLMCVAANDYLTGYVDASANFSSIYFAGSVGKSFSTGDCGSNMTLSTDCYLLDVNGDGQWNENDKLIDQQSFYVTPIITTTATSIHPELNLTFTFADIGTYTAAKDGLVFNGCANAATRADVGATNVIYKVTLNQ